MDLSEIKEKLSSNYEIDTKEIKKIKNVYKITANSSQYCLKEIHYDYGHFLFIVSAIEHLIKNEFECIPDIIRTKDKRNYIKIKEGYAYLTKWIDSKLCDYDNTVELVKAVSALAKLHIKSWGFELTKEMNPRIGWLKWIKQFETRIDEMLDFKKRIEAKEKKTEFDTLYMNMMEEEIIRAKKSIDDIENCDYFYKMEKEINYKGFCHHDYAHHNLLVNSQKEINIIDFDYCILDTHLHDLSSIMIRKMKNGKWDMATAIFILDVYNSVYNIEDTDVPLMAAFMEFPQAYWQIGIQYYWEKQPWTEEFFISKLKKINEDKENRQEFLEELMTFKYKN
ncbi:CotS family spore coat protein [Clostridium guangxiense]|uniref:CotS family spore coat protein n=1 Tax=Clostridium guangxiense TaxID=1662055 RepID=UPI001E361319|nr:CotS family spore coat protein [Clostridium guangxiense]